MQNMLSDMCKQQNCLYNNKNCAEEKNDIWHQEPEIICAKYASNVFKGAIIFYQEGGYLSARVFHTVVFQIKIIIW